MAEKKICSNCKNAIRKDSVYCEICGEKVEEKTGVSLNLPVFGKVCGVCNGINEKKAEFCQHCGNLFQAAEPSDPSGASETGEILRKVAFWAAMLHSILYLLFSTGFYKVWDALPTAMLSFIMAICLCDRKRKLLAIATLAYIALPLWDLFFFVGISSFSITLRIVGLLIFAGIIVFSVFVHLERATILLQKFWFIPVIISVIYGRYIGSDIAARLVQYTQFRRVLAIASIVDVVIIIVLESCLVWLFARQDDLGELEEGRGYNLTYTPYPTGLMAYACVTRTISALLPFVNLSSLFANASDSDDVFSLMFDIRYYISKAISEGLTSISKNIGLEGIKIELLIAWPGVITVLGLWMIYISVKGKKFSPDLYNSGMQIVRIIQFLPAAISTVLIFYISTILFKASNYFGSAGGLGLILLFVAVIRILMALAVGGAIGSLIRGSKVARFPKVPLFMSVGTLLVGIIEWAARSGSLAVVLRCISTILFAFGMFVYNSNIRDFNLELERQYKESCLKEKCKSSSDTAEP